MGKLLPAEERALRIAADIDKLQKRVTHHQVATASLVAFNCALQNCSLALKDFGAAYAAAKKRKAKR